MIHANRQNRASEKLKNEQTIRYKDMKSQQYLLFFIMQQVIEKSLRVTVLQEISQLNRTNAEFYSLLRKLNSTETHLNQTFSQRLETMRADIRDKIKQLAANVDLMYQMLDRKISLLIRKIQSNPINAQNYEQQLRLRSNRIKQLEQQVNNNKTKFNAVITQNQYLKNKNIALIQQLEMMAKKKTNTVTNDSSRNIPKTDMSQDHQAQLENHVSPIQQPPLKPQFANDMTFNNSPRNLSDKKHIKSQQNSFSSLLIQQQKSFQVSYGSDRKESNKFQFGCMPTRPSQDGINFKSPSKNKNSQQEADVNQSRQTNGDQNHRMSFLINNLKDSHQQSFASQSSRQMYANRDESVGKSVLSRGAVKKYHI